jgi:glycosyltransferase involved in cell wall biosynthesis
MRLAFVDSLPVGGGLSRFSYMLCKSLLEYEDTLYVDYFVHHENLIRTPELLNMSERVRVKLLHTTMPPSIVGKLFRKLSIALNMGFEKGNTVANEITKRVIGYDLAYFPSAHMMPVPSLQIPVVGTIHDFNWKYFFGRQIFSNGFVNQMDKEVVKWMTGCETICSSHDVVMEAKKLYPELPSYPIVVHIAPVTFSKNIDEAVADRILNDLHIDYPYIIFPGNFFPHKNHLNLFSAFSLLKRRKGFRDLKLILTGIDTEQVAYGIAERGGVQLKSEINKSSDFDVRGLGYQPNDAIDALISKAKLLVSPSIYEAICTPGMDAWSFGTPTAISDIPPFREHEEVWGIKSAFFDPMDPKNMADVIESYLNNYGKALEDGKTSKTNMATYTWKQVAQSYLRVFKEAVDKK